MADRDPAAVEMVANAYHWAACRSCHPENCPGAAECVYAEHLDVSAFGAVLDALAAAGWVPPREVKRLRVLERMAAKHASERDRDIAAAEAKLLTLRAEIERWRQREAQHHADRAAEDLAELSATPPEGGERP